MASRGDDSIEKTERDGLGDDERDEGEKRSMWRDLSGIDQVSDILP